MGKDIGHFSKYNRSKISPPTLKKPRLSFSAAHTSSASNLERIYISSQLDKKDITTNQDKNKTSNIDDIHSCVTPRKQNYSVQATSTTTRLKPLHTTLNIAPIELHTPKHYPWLVKNICVFRLREDLLMLPSVSNHG